MTRVNKRKTKKSQISRIYHLTDKSKIDQWRKELSIFKLNNRDQTFQLRCKQTAKKDQFAVHVFYSQRE